MRLSPLLAATALLTLPTAAQSSMIEIVAGVWQQDAGGSIAYKQAAVTDRINVGSEAGWDEETRPMVRVKIETLSILPNIYAMATPMEFDGTVSQGASTESVSENLIVPMVYLGAQSLRSTG